MLRHLETVRKQLSTRRGQFWFAWRRKGGTTWTSNPTLFEVFWVPALLALNHGSFKRYRGEATVVMLWGYWKDQNLPWRLKKRYDALHAQLRAERRVSRTLRMRLVENEQKGS